MIPANHNRFTQCLFNKYLKFILKSDFKHIELEGQWPLSDAGALVVGNHIGWWDGFWVLYLKNRLCPAKKLHVMMLEEQLKPRPFLGHLGAFSIRPGSRSALESLKYAADRLGEPNNWVVIYPQGKLAAMTADILPFQPGIEVVLRRANVRNVLFYAAFVDYFSDRKPSLFFYLKQEKLETQTASELEAKYRKFYETSRLNHSYKAK